MNKNNRNYVNGPALHNALKNWYLEGSDNPPDIVIDAIMQICERLGTRNNFKNYSYIDEMIGEALLACVVAVQQKKYDPFKYSNPFAYFTQIAYNEFIRVIKEEHKETYIKHKTLINHIVEASFRGEEIEYEDDDSGRLDTLVDKFEGKKK